MQHSPARLPKMVGSNTSLPWASWWYCDPRNLVSWVLIRRYFSEFLTTVLKFHDFHSLLHVEVRWKKGYKFISIHLVSYFKKRDALIKDCPTDRHIDWPTNKPTEDRPGHREVWLPISFIPNLSMTRPCSTLKRKSWSQPVDIQFDDLLVREVELWLGRLVPLLRLLLLATHQLRLRLNIHM